MALDKATIINLETREQIPVMFNPEEYSLDLGNTFAEIGIPGLQTSPIQYVRGNLRTLKMELFFDTYEQKVDVRTQTRRITSLLNKNATTQAPPILLFSWGSLQFKCVLESVGQNFTMFLRDGMPVRAKLSVNFKEFEPVEIEIERGLFIGPPTVRNVVEGDTLSKIAGELLGNPGDWRKIAEQNDIDDPFNLPPGQSLIIPTGRSNVRQ
ncbi:MAG: LysM peptidoglycan-binding domain-containing protein [Crocosphaera sp.]|nr:LysM peptidoglycan-binding domain-containing protein [Crocosphaera sp.]